MSIFLINMQRLRKKILRFNNNTFMTKALKTVIIHKSIVKNVYHKYRTNENQISYKKQKNLCVHFLQKAKEIFPKTTCKTIIG